tara:strand:+ start:698 stop:1276 length:579 start_codon:yes stop_codon:yes gene_type:complete
MKYRKDITDYILFNLPADAERIYPRTTKNFYYIDTHGFQLWFSYRTLIAYRDHSWKLDSERVSEAGSSLLVISRNVWSPTTARHLYWIDPDHSKRLDFEVFEARALEDLGDDFGTPERDSNPFRSAGMVSALFSLMHSNESEEDQKKANKQRLRFYQATSPGFIIPDDWDQLTAEEQSRRLDMVDTNALRGI